MPAPLSLLTRLIEDEDRRRRILADHAAGAVAIRMSDAQASRVHAEICRTGFPIIKDWKSPDYAPFWDHRARVLERIRSDRSVIPILKAHYKLAPWDFIDDWGVTMDPRNAEIKLPVRMPFILFPKQTEWLKWVMARWYAREPGLTEKSRDAGVTWLSVGLSDTLCLHYDDLNIGFGSRKVEYVDKKNAPKSIFWKARKFMDHLPPEFNGGWNSRTDAPYMRITFRETGSTIVGEGGDGIGRGDRASIYWVDEAAHIEDAEATEAALSQTTNCRQDISSVKGSTNVFAIKRHSGKVKVFIFDWKDDPRKDQAWYDKQVAELDPVVVAQEIDRDYSASVAGIIIPAAWVRSAIDAHIALGFTDEGGWMAGNDIADEGPDLNALSIRKGVVLKEVDDWADRDGGAAARYVINYLAPIASRGGGITVQYDSIGVGATMKAEINRLRDDKKIPRGLQFSPWNAGAGVVNPDKPVNPHDKQSETNKDFFANLKAQAWWALRDRFYKVHRMRTEKGVSYPTDQLISISGKIEKLQHLVRELSQPTMGEDSKLRRLVDKLGDGTKSPNLADAVVMNYFPLKAPMFIPDSAIMYARQGGRR